MLIATNTQNVRRYVFNILEIFKLAMKTMSLWATNYHISKSFKEQNKKLKVNIFFILNNLYL